MKREKEGTGSLALEYGILGSSLPCTHFTGGESEAREGRRSSCSRTVKDVKWEPGPKGFAGEELPA